MKKTNLLYVKLNEHQIENIKQINKLKDKTKLTHGIIWEGHGQIFGDEKLISKFWNTWSLELNENEKESHTDIRSIFLECIKLDEYSFKTYEQKKFSDEIAKIQNELAIDLNARRMKMVEDEYQKALEKVREASENYTPSLAEKIKPIIFFIVAMIFMVSVFSALK